MNFRHNVFYLYRLLNNVATFLKFKVRATQNKAALNNLLIIWLWHAQIHFQVSIFGPDKWWRNLSHPLFHIIGAYRSATSTHWTFSWSKTQRRCDWIVQEISSCLPVSFPTEFMFVTDVDDNSSSYWWQVIFVTNIGVSSFSKAQVLFQIQRVGCWDGGSELHCGCILHNGVGLGTLLLLQLVSRPLALVVLSNRINRLFVWQCNIHWYSYACWRMR